MYDDSASHDRSESKLADEADYRLRRYPQVVMGVIEFLDALPQAGETLNPNTYSELSGISTGEADELALAWAGWAFDRVIELLDGLVVVGERDPRLEFEPVFKAALSSPDPRARGIALAGLAESTDRTLIKPWVEILESDDDTEVRAVAAMTLATLSEMAAEGKLSRADTEKIFDALCAVLDRPDEPAVVRGGALESLSVFGGPRVSAYIGSVYSNRDLKLRRSALSAMARACDDTWLDRIILDLDHEDSGVRLQATNALGEIGQEHHIVHLTGPLDDQDIKVQLVAVAAVEQLGGVDARRLLQHAAASPEPAVAAAAQNSLASLADTDGLGVAVTPEMAESGLFGAPMASQAEDTSDHDEYDAADSEGWAKVDAAPEAPGETDDLYDVGAADEDVDPDRELYVDIEDPLNDPDEDW